MRVQIVAVLAALMALAACGHKTAGTPTAAETSHMPTSSPTTAAAASTVPATTTPAATTPAADSGPIHKAYGRYVTVYYGDYPGKSVAATVAAQPKIYDAANYGTKPDNGHYVVFDAIVKNIDWVDESGAPATYEASSFAWYLTDGAGHHYEWNGDSGGGYDKFDPEFPDAELAKGEIARGSVVIDSPITHGWIVYQQDDQAMAEWKF